MNLFDDLNEKNYVMFAMKYYDNLQCTSVEEFNEDLNKIKYVKRLFNRFLETGELRTNLIMNHLIILFNVFHDAAVPLLFYNLEEELWPIVKSFLVYLKRIPEYPKTKVDTIDVDEKVIQELNNL